VDKLKITYKRLDDNTVVGRFGKMYIFINRMPHGGFYSSLSKDKIIIASEGRHTTHLETLVKAKAWVRGKIKQLYGNNSSTI